MAVAEASRPRASGRVLQTRVFRSRLGSPSSSRPTPTFTTLLPVTSLLLLLLLPAIVPSALAEVSSSTIDADKRAIILFDTFGFGPRGHVDITLSNVSLEVPEGKTDLDKSRLGFFISTAEAELSLQNDFLEGKCVLEDPNIQKLLTLADYEAGKNEEGSFAFNYSVPTSAEYSLFFANCQPHVRVNMVVDFSLYNIDQSAGVDRRDYLPAGKTELPWLYLAFFLAYAAAGAAWVYVCMQQRPTVHNIHVLMGVLVFLKAFTVLSQAGEYAYIKATGAPHGWNVVFYVFTGLRGVMLFTVIVLIGTGWSFLKPYLQDREKKVIMIVIPLQVFANIATIVLDESGPSSQSWLTWRDVFHLLDIVCCCAILFPIVWSIKHLREAAATDGKAARNMVKLSLFRHFYVMVVCYIYFTRIIVYLLRSTMPYRHAWTAELAGELATLLFYCVTGYMFRPMDQNPYFALEEEEEAAAQQALKEEDDEFGL